ncbi:MAG: MauE/DoxX family redox-associated membrane protein [Pseudomonadota bacterium]
MNAATENSTSDLDKSTADQSDDGGTAWFYARLLLGTLLVLAAILKWYSPVESATLHVEYGVPAWLIAVTAQFELALGIALLCGVHARQVRLLTLTTFTVFAAFAVYRIALGAESCGCFGSVKVSPWWTLALDLVVLAAMACVRIPCSSRRSSPKRDSLALAVYGLLALVFFAGSLNEEGTAARANSPLEKVAGLYLLEPDDWVGGAFPLTDFLSPQPAGILEGNWTVILYHHDCSACRESMPKYAALAATGNTPVAVVEVPPYGDDSNLLSTNLIHTKLSDDEDWFVQTPVEIQLSGGVVTAVSHESPGATQPN